MTLDTHNWPSSARQELHKIVKDEIFPIVNQVDTSVQNFEIQFLKEAAKFVRDFKSHAKETDESLAKHKALELEIKRLLRAVVSQDIMSIVEHNSVGDTSNLQTELERTKEQFENCIIKKENEYAKLWNDWYKKCEECKYGKISYDKAYNDMQQKIERLQAQLGDVKGMFRINPFKPSREEKYVLNKVRASVKTNSIIVSPPLVITKKVVNSDSKGLSSTRVDNTAKIRKPQPRSNTKNDRVPSASKSSCSKNKEVEVEEHPRNLLLSKNKKHMSSECNNVKLATQNVKSIVVCAMCKQCLISTNHDVCLLNYVNDMNSRGKKQKANVSINENQKKQKPKVMKPKKVGSNERLASPKPSKSRSFLRWSLTGRLFDLKGKIIASSESKSQYDCSNGDNACCSKHGNLRLLINFVWKFLGTVRFGNDHVAAILGLDLEVAFRRNTCFVRNLEGVDLLKRNGTTYLYTINLYEMASASLICLMARATSTKPWLWHQHLSHLNFDTINDLAKNDLVTGLLKFKYHKEHICPLCQQGKSKRASHQPKLVPNSKQRLHLLYMDLCGPISKDEAPGVIKTFLKRITILFQSLVIIKRTENDTEFKNQVLKEYFDSVGISHQVSSVRTPQQNGVVERRNWTLVEAARTMLISSHASLFLWAEAIATACYTQNKSIIHRRFNKTTYELINGKKPDISFLHVFGDLCFPKNDRKDIRKLGAKGDIGFFIGYSADSCAYKVYIRRTKKSWRQ
nr:hypothetical protein [Tanacetum cinerariifolium]